MYMYIYLHVALYKSIFINTCINKAMFWMTIKILVFVIQVWGQKEKEDSIKGRKWERENEAQIQEGTEGCH